MKLADIDIRDSFIVTSLRKVKTGLFLHQQKSRVIKSKYFQVYLLGRKVLYGNIGPNKGYIGTRDNIYRYEINRDTKNPFKIITYTVDQ